MSREPAPAGDAVRSAAGLCTLLLLAAGCGTGSAVLTTAEALALPQPPPDRRVAYGDEPLQLGELRLPESDGPFPVAVVLHGGCWLAEYDLGYMSGLAGALTAEGIATWSLEYRRVGDEGGGWPGTFLDVARGTDYLRVLAREAPIDLDRVVAVGHSAGGHLALWLGGRDGLPAGSALAVGDPLRLVGAVSLAGIPDLASYSSDDGCGSAVPALIGGDPGEVSAERLAETSPIEMLPSGIPVRLLIGDADPIVPREQAASHAAAARRAGDDVRVVEIERAGHFELVVPEGEAWDAVGRAVLELVGGGRPEPGGG